MLVSKAHIRGAMKVPLAKAMDKFFARARATMTHQIGTGKIWAERLTSLWNETVADHDSLNNETSRAHHGPHRDGNWFRRFSN
jgi:hypothetical protein